MAYMPKTKVKSLGKLMVDYIRISAETGVHDPELEALREFFGKKGQTLKRPLRSKKQQKKFEEAVKAAKEKYGNKPSKAKMKKEMQRRKEAADTQKQKATKTWRKKKVEEAKKSEGKKNFRSVAQKAARQYSNMVDVFKDEALRDLIRAYGIGSPIIEYLAEQGLTAEEIRAFIEQWAARIDDMPEEARALASVDDMFTILKEISEEYGSDDFEDFSAMFMLSLDAEASGATSEVWKGIIDLWEESGGNKTMPFAEFYGKLQQYDDPFNINNADEVLENDN